MKLNPPASSSDLEIAREIARRLHQRRRREDRPAEDSTPPLAPPPVRAAITPAHPPPPEPPDAPPLEGLADLDSPPPPDEEPAPGRDEIFSTEEPEIEVEGENVSPEEMVGSSEPPAFDDPAPDAFSTEASPFDVEIDEADEPQKAEGAVSWDAVVDSCRELAQAGGAMLADPLGQVFAVRGDWPEPGPGAIAGKLVAMMNRTLKDAPTRSISAPLMGKHLTAWRVPLEEGLVTVAFVGDAPVRAESRPAIDTEIHRGAGA
jgi:hypothetical protein